MTDEDKKLLAFARNSTADRVLLLMAYKRQKEAEKLLENKTETAVYLLLDK